MSKTRFTPGKHIWGMAISLVLFLVGGWLILSPFALTYQGVNQDWTNQTINDFVVGIGVALVALLTFALFLNSLIASLRAAGIVAPRPQVQTVAPAAYPPPAPAPVQSDLDRTLSNLAAALAADLSSRRSGQLPSPHQIGSDQNSTDQQI